MKSGQPLSALGSIAQQISSQKIGTVYSSLSSAQLSPVPSFPFSLVTLAQPLRQPLKRWKLREDELIEVKSESRETILKRFLK